MHRIADDGRVIRVTGAGLFSEDEARGHFEALSLLIARRRRSAGQVRMLIDLRQAATQPAAITAMIAEQTGRLYSDPSDRVAIVVGSVLLKLQLKRVHRAQSVGVFLSPEEAEAFLVTVATPADT